MTDRDMTNADDNNPSYYVGIGASAGGLEAIETFFKNMPDNSGATFIVVQHLSPKHKSMMADLLSRHTKMPVGFADDHMVAEPNAIYLIPPNKNLTIFHGKLLLTEQDRDHGLNLPIDVFLRSLAEDQGEKAVAIILSGTGSDGTRGLRMIKEKLGMVLVQDEASAKFDGMPKSATSTGMADFVLPVEELPRQLINYIQRPFPDKNSLTAKMFQDDGGLTRIFFLLREKEGVDFTYYKPSTLLRRLERRMLVNNMNNLDDYVRFIENSPTEVSTLYHELLIGVTNFFRDPEAFKILEEKIFPEIFESSERHEIRIWVAGCSTGEEAYSIAMLCRSIMEKMGKVFDVRVFATDVDRNAITFASNGIYPESIAADVPTSLLSKYFVRLGDSYQVSHSIRQMVIFAQHNLIKDPPFTKMNMVCCRNLLIYFQPVLQHKVMDMFNFALIPNGIMFLGASETTGENADYFYNVDNKWKIFKSKGKRKNQPLFSGDTKYGSRSPVAVSRQFALKAQEEEMMMNRLMQTAAEDYMPITFVINSHNDLIHTLGNADGLFRPPSGKTTNDITRIVAKDLSVPLSTGLHKVFTNQEAVSYSNIHVRSGDKVATYKLTIRSLPWKQGQERLVAAFLELSHSKEQAVDNIVQRYDASKEAEQRIVDLEQSLQFHKENLQATIEELETSNEELQATNEELMASNEELQSTNEELQSVNEELYTLNAEYQAKIIELTELNNDLENLYRATEATTLFLDENLNIRKFTAADSNLINLIEADIDRPFSHVHVQVQHEGLYQLAQQVQKSGKVFTKDVQSEVDSRWYLMKIKPYLIGKSVASGVLFSFTEISYLKSVEHNLLASNERNVMALGFSQMGSWNWDVETGRLDCSDNIEAMFGVDHNEAGWTFDLFMGAVHPDDRQALQSSINACLIDGEPYNSTHRIVWPDGSIHWIEEVGNATRSKEGGANKMYGLVRDVTHEKHAHQALNESKSYLRAVLGLMTDAEISIDKHGIISAFNHAAERLFGYEAGEIMGRNVNILIPEPDRSRHDQYLQNYLRSGKASSVLKVGRTVKAMRKDGLIIPIHLAVSEVYCEGEPIYIGIIRTVINEEVLYGEAR